MVPARRRGTPLSRRLANGTPHRGLLGVPMAGLSRPPRRWLRHRRARGMPSSELTALEGRRLPPMSRGAWSRMASLTF
eukprot:3580535-Alexandrium_andersonii.AAC.1